MNKTEVLCPVCQDVNNHQIGATLFSAADCWDSHAITYTNIMETPPVFSNIETPNRNRNMSVMIHFICESGHQWKRYYSFHKGETSQIDYKTENELPEDFKNNGGALGIKPSVLSVSFPIND